VGWLAARVTVDVRLGIYARLSRRDRRILVIVALCSVRFLQARGASPKSPLKTGQFW
jgi:hypothetical protein